MIEFLTGVDMKKPGRGSPRLKDDQDGLGGGGYTIRGYSDLPDGSPAMLDRMEVSDWMLRIL